MRAYITVRAVKEWMAIVGSSPADDGQDFDDAALELEALLADSRVVAAGPNARETGPTAGALVERRITKTQIDGKMHRIELYVSYAKRPEGDLPQLVRVRDKGR